MYSTDKLRQIYILTVSVVVDIPLTWNNFKFLEKYFLINNKEMKHIMVQVNWWNIPVS